MGAIMGVLFVGVVYLANLCDIEATIAGAAFPMTTLIVFCAAPVLYFAFGAAITGFLFLVSDGNQDGAP